MNARRKLLTWLLGWVALGCGSTLDSLGGSTDGASGAAGAFGTLAEVPGPASYPNAFRDLLGKTDAAIENKLTAAYEQLFHGDPASEAIYVPVGSEQAYLLDALHGDVRSEGSAVGMLIAVELDRQDELDRLWSYARSELKVTSGPASGYFRSFCDEHEPCLDPYGMQLFALSLVLAHGRWGSSASHPYDRDAVELLGALRDREQQNGGVLDGIVSVFDATTHLVREQPRLDSAGYTRSALEMPAAYDHWARATGDPFWHEAALAARTHLSASADARTGLWPLRSYFDGKPVPGASDFTAQAYRTQLNLALDALWQNPDPKRAELADRSLGFFTLQGLGSYGSAFALDGTTLDPSRRQALIAVNGALAVAASRPERVAFVDAVWNQSIPTGEARYFDGILYLLSLLTLSGQLRVY